MRYTNIKKRKANGVIYTPKEMADYLAQDMLRFHKDEYRETIRILDPAVGEGELLIAMIKAVNNHLSSCYNLEVVGFETDKTVANATQRRLENMFPNVDVSIYAEDFLEQVEKISCLFDFVIANPPYIRTQILGSDHAQDLAQRSGLSGKIDVYYAFLISAKAVIADGGVAGYITSNKFLTIKSGVQVRNFMLQNYKIHHIIDFGDTRLFQAAVLPCTITFSNGSTKLGSEVDFTSVYESKDDNVAPSKCLSIFDCINSAGIFEVADGRKFKIEQGTLRDATEGALWTITSNEKLRWLSIIDRNTWLHFSDIGKIRVGIKTTADNVFIGENWDGELADIELLRPLITHRNAGQVKSSNTQMWKVLYTHTFKDGKKVAYNIDDYPKAKAYLSHFYDQLSQRTYLAKAHRNWYEIWVPQNPNSWNKRKIVFRDISEKPQFWIDDTGAIVNGDCYWIEIDPLVDENVVYLALAIANSQFIEKYYDARFNTKLYSGKRRFISQYVEKFPIPYPYTDVAQSAVDLVKRIIAEDDENIISYYKNQLNDMVNGLFAAN